jgi:hypothetical protein
LGDLFVKQLLETKELVLHISSSNQIKAQFAGFSVTWKTQNKINHLICVSGQQNLHSTTKSSDTPESVEITYPHAKGD